MMLRKSDSISVTVNLPFTLTAVQREKLVHIKLGYIKMGML